MQRTIMSYFCSGNFCGCSFGDHCHICHQLQCCTTAACTVSDISCDSEVSDLRNGDTWRNALVSYRPATACRAAAGFRSRKTTHVGLSFLICCEPAFPFNRQPGRSTLLPNPLINDEKGVRAWVSLTVPRRGHIMGVCRMGGGKCGGNQPPHANDVISQLRCQTARCRTFDLWFSSPFQPPVTAGFLSGIRHCPTPPAPRLPRRGSSLRSAEGYPFVYITVPTSPLSGAPSQSADACR